MDHPDSALLRVDRPAKLDLLAFVDDLPAVLLIDAVEHLHEGGLARAVFADQRMHFTKTNVNIGIIQCVNTRNDF